MQCFSATGDLLNFNQQNKRKIMKKILRVLFKPFVLVCLVFIFVGLTTVFSQKQFAASLIFGDSPQENLRQSSILNLFENSLPPTERHAQETLMTRSAEQSKHQAENVVEPATNSLGAYTSFEKDKKFGALISKALENGKMRVIIGFEMPFVAEGKLSDGFAELQRSNIRSAQENLLDRLSQFAVSNVKQFEFIPFMAIETDAAALESLKNDPEVTFIQEDSQYEALIAESTPVVGANASWTAGFAGSGYTVAILDTGVDKSHPFLNGTKVVSEACYSTTSATLYNSVCPGGVTSSTASGSGVNCSTSISGCDHGTHVAGIAAGNNTLTNIDGVARDSSIIAIQVFSKDLWANKTTAITSDIIKGLERVYALRSTYNIAAVNLSLGGGAYTSNCDSTEIAFKSAIDNLRSANIATVAAAGNDGLTNALAFPACISTAVSVGSTRDGSSSNGAADTVSTTFSNSASFLSILAPGELINSSVPGTGYDFKQGTSMAAPHVAGAWAILKQRMGSGATVQQVLDRLNDTGVPVTDSRNNITKKRIKIDTAVYVGCNPSLSSNNSRISSSGGSGSFSLTILSNCGWNAVSNVPWLTTSSTATGSGTITYSVAANNSTSERTGVISAAGQEFRVTQTGASCSFSFSPATQSISVTGGMGSTYIFAPTGCSWSTSNDSSSWLTITSGGSGNGNGLLTYSAAANLSVLQREAKITLTGGQTFTVTQPANTGNQACTTSPSNLAAWYRGEGNANDSQGVNNGTAQNGATFAAGQVGQALSLDGVDDYVSVPDSNSLDITGAMTIETWVYPTMSRGRIISKQSFNGGSTSYVLEMNFGKLIFYSTDAATNQMNILSSNLEIPLNQWSHIAVTMSASSFSFYVNGVAESRAANLTNRPVTDGPLYIGVTKTEAGSGVAYFGGKIDELSLYNRVLTATELLSVYNAGGAGKCAPQCTYSINPASVGNPTSPGVAAAGGVVSTNVTAPAGCAWTVNNSNSWITVTSGASGTGSGTVQLSVAANNSPNSRTGMMTIAGQAFTVTQAGQNCTYSVPTSSFVGPEAGSFAVNVTAPAGCAWTAENTNNLDWLIFTTGSGTGSGTAYLYVGPNTSSAPRSGVVTIAGQEHTVIQLGVSCSYSISSTSYSIGSGGSNWFFDITSPAGCSWSAVSNVPWITFFYTPSSGSGNGTINYLVAVNNGGQRTGVITIAGLTHTVTQGGVSTSTQTNTGQNVTVTPTSNSNITFSNVSTAGTTSVNGLSQNQLEPLPANFSLIGNPIMYNITTSAVFSGTIMVTFAVPNIADSTACSRLRTLHYTNNVWDISNNATPSYNSGVCTVSQTVTSLSPFVVAQISATSYSIGGTVTYGITAANQTPSIISGVKFNASGASGQSAVSDLSGNYQLSDLTSGGNYTITPTKTDEVKGINSLDATRIQQHRVGLITLTPNQLLAADTDNSGTVNSLDATRIQQRLVGIQSANIIGQWKFVPGSKQYNSVTSNVTGENYQAVLVGEVSGNWASAASFADDSQPQEFLLPKAGNQSYLAESFEQILAEQIAKRMKQSTDLQSYDPVLTNSKSKPAVTGASVNVSLPSNATAATGSSITVPVTIGAVPAGSPIESFDFTVFYDPAVLQPANPSGSNAGTLSANCSVLANSPTAGRIVVSGACATGITTSSGGVLYNLNFNVIGTSGQQTGLLFNNPATGAQTFQFNSGNPAANTTNGLFSVLGPTAASVTVSGKVTNNQGRGIRNVLITMTDSQGRVQTAQTTAFGYYKFESVAAGETVTISAKARRFKFVQSSIVRTTNESVTDADFIREQ